MAEGSTQATGGDLPSAVTALAPLIEACAGELERTGRLPPALLARLHEARLFRLLLPASLGGLEVSPATYVETLEQLAMSDASTAWLVAQGSGCTIAAVYLVPDVAREIFGPADAVLAWGPGPGITGAKAVAVDGGYRLTGKWHFASGNRQAQWMGAHCIVYDEQGGTVPGPNGKPLDRTLLFPRSEARIKDNWHVIGLRGTGSDSYSVTDLYVPAKRTYTRDSPTEKREHGPLYQFTAMNIFAFGVAAIALGIARVMLREFVAMAQTKTDRATGAPLKSSGAVQSDLAKAEAKLLSSRAFMLDTARELYASVAATGGQPFTFDQRTRMRLSTVWAATQAREVADFAYHAAGTAAMFEGGPFERRYRDIHSVSQQIQAHAANFELAGRALLGVPVNSHLL